MRKILYIDNCSINTASFEKAFSKHFAITYLSHPIGIFNLLEGHSFDAILLEIHFSNKDAFELITEISQSRFSHIPILIFTSDELLGTRLKALATAASDIIYRTYSEEEIRLRILNKINLFSQRVEKKKHLNLDSLGLNLETLEAFHKTSNLNLTPIEFKILSTLVQNFPEKISRDTLVKQAWSSENVLDRTVNTHLSNLRSKLPKAEFEIESLRGNGVMIKKIEKVPHDSGIFISSIQ
jgi:DNA-binding response OmpR family regulator